MFFLDVLIRRCIAKARFGFQALPIVSYKVKGSARFFFVRNIGNVQRRRRDFQRSTLTQRKQRGGRRGGGGRQDRTKTSAAGNRMHMALRRMNGWIQEMERKRGEGDIPDHSCAQKLQKKQQKKSCFEARRDVLLFFPLPVKGRKASVLRRGLNRVVSLTAAFSHAAICSLSTCFRRNATKCKALFILLTRSKVTVEFAAVERCLKRALGSE